MDGDTEHRVLIVEDLEDDLLLTRRAIRRLKFPPTCRIARDGQEALDVLREEGYIPHLVLLDVKLPKLSGFDVLRLAQDALRPETNIVIISSSDEPQDLKQAQLYPVREYLVKPVIPEQYVAAIQRVCCDYLPKSASPQEP